MSKHGGRGLTDKQRKFIDEYMVDLNATQAAIRAGYSVKTANRIGTQNLSKLVIAEEIQKRQKAVADKLELTRDMVIKELASIGFSSVTDYVNVTGKGHMVEVKETGDLPHGKQSAIAYIKQGNFGVEVKLHDKVRALEMLGKHLGLFELAKLNNDKDMDIEDMNTLAEMLNDYTDTDN